MKNKITIIFIDDSYAKSKSDESVAIISYNYKDFNGLIGLLNKNMKI